MSGDVHVRFWESAGVRFPRSTHLPMHRLERILQRLREATGLEQALRQAEAVHFDLAELLRLQVGALHTTYPDCRLRLSGVEAPVGLVGVPDLISQAVDKLVGNAIDFHTPGSAIDIVCAANGPEIEIRVRNAGPPLPAETDIFQSMVSGRQGRQDEPHLGLGLYLVRLIADFHGGTAQAYNIDSPQGVRVNLALSRQPSR